MNQRAAILHKLVVDGHVNVAERKTLGAVNRSEVAALLKSLLYQDRLFPKQKAGAVYEGSTLSLLPDGVRLSRQRAYPSNPFTVAERSEQDFARIEDAIEAFIDSEWGNEIDGVRLG